MSQLLCRLEMNLLLSCQNLSVLLSVFSYFKRSRSITVNLLLPAPAKRPVELYETLELVTAVLRQSELGAE